MNLFGCFTIRRGRDKGNETGLKEEEVMKIKIYIHIRDARFSLFSLLSFTYCYDHFSSIRFSLGYHIPCQSFLATYSYTAVQHEFGVGFVVHRVVLQQLHSCTVQLCLQLFQLFFRQHFTMYTIIQHGSRRFTFFF